jgi:sulfotransferase family protein
MLLNVFKSVRNVVSGQHLATIKSYYDPRFPPTKFLRFGAPTMHVKCILCGFPRTGTHWIRNVIRTSTGLGDYAVAAKGPLPDNSNELLVKVHARNKLIARMKALWLLPRHDFEGKYIYTYRDPRDAILSLYEMYKHRKGVPDLSQSDFLKRYDPIGQFRWEIKAWVIRKHENVLCVKFEDLKQHPLTEFQKIFRYLGLNAAVNEQSLSKPVSNADGANRPRRVAYAWKHAPDEYAPLIRTVSEQLESEIRALNYEVQ